MSRPATVPIVVPTLNEATGTFELAARYACAVRCAASRATQMNADVLMQLLKLRCLFGVDPERIRRRYEAGTRRGRRCSPTR
jgi:hypothetical protein